MNEIWSKLAMPTKFLILLFGLASFALFSFLTLATYIFEADKTAYIFDSSAQLTQSLASQARNQILAMEKIVIPILDEFSQTGKLGFISQSIFSSDANIQSLGIYEITNQQPKNLIMLEKTGTLINDILKANPDIRLALISTVQNRRQIFTPFNDERILLIEPLSSKIEGRQFVVLGIFFADELKGILREKSIGKTAIFRKDASILFATELSLSLPTGLLLKNSAYKEFLKSELNQQSLILNSKNNKSWLVSIAKVGVGDLMVVVFTDRSQVSEAISTLTKRALYFFGLLISLAFMVSIFMTRSMISRLNQLTEATKKIAKGDFSLNLDLREFDEVGNLATSFQHMNQEIVRQLSETMIKIRSEIESATARAVQENLLPQSKQIFEHITIVGHYEPALECSGDWWYYSKVGTKYIMCVGDATGHGAQACLITSAARAAFATATRENLSPAQLLEWINYAIFEMGKSRLMMTMFVGEYDPLTGILTYANASHEPSFLIKDSDAKISKRDLIVLDEVNGPRLGERNIVNYQEAMVQLRPGDALYFYTDGLKDVQNESGIALGERVFLKILTSAFSESKEASKRAEFIEQAIKKYRKSTILHDDITFFTCQVMKDSENHQIATETSAILKISA